MADAVVADNISLAIIGGSGFSEFASLKSTSHIQLSTPYGPVNDLVVGQYQGVSVAFLPRHGKEHQVPPHLVNYRANMWALHQLGVRRVLALNAVGSTNEAMVPGSFVLPLQIIDYSYGREHTYFNGSISLEGRGTVEHIDFTFPYDSEWRDSLVSVARSQAVPIISQGVYACTQGPRLETAAEIARIKRDGGDIVGMTGMPEAALARELTLRYASLAIVVNWAAGIGDQPLSMQGIFELLEKSKKPVEEFIVSVIQSLDSVDIR